MQQHQTFPAVSFDIRFTLYIFHWPKCSQHHQKLFDIVGKKRLIILATVRPVKYV